MTRRRFVALLLSLTMLHLSVVAGDAACATHDAGAQHASRADHAARGEQVVLAHGHVMIPDVGHQAAMSTARDPGSRMPPCDVPAQQHCCDALVGCSVASAVASAPQSPAPRTSRSARVGVALDDEPTSLAAAPEPPPPKA
jgi:hypothetical protein